MKTPPPIALKELEAALVAAYGVCPAGLSFLPCGECSWGYRVIEADGPGYFLKLYRGGSPPEWSARLVRRLAEETGLAEISAPLPDRAGRLTSQLAGFPAALFRWVEGPTLWAAGERSEILCRLGQLLARLHACRELRGSCQRVENFDLTGEADFRRVLAALEGSAPAAGSPAARAAFGLLAPVRSRLAVLLEELLKAQTRARSQPRPLCICHGDPTPGNVLAAAGGQICLIDWDDLILAPRERDLVFWADGQAFFEGETANPVLEGYAGLAGPVRLDEDIMSFYQRQWTVGEIAAFGGRLLFETPKDEQAESDLSNLEEELRWI